MLLVDDGGKKNRYDTHARDHRIAWENLNHVNILESPFKNKVMVLDC